eukprot:gene7081-11244_t
MGQAVSNNEDTNQSDYPDKLKFLNYNILVLGGTESGKSTIVSQMRRFSGITTKLSGIQFYRNIKDNLCFNEKELKVFLPFIRENIFTLTKECLKTMKEKKLFFDNENNQEFADLFLANDMDVEKLFMVQNIKKLALLWNEPIIKSALKKFGNVDFHLHDGCDYLLEPRNIIRFNNSKPELVEEDIVHCYRKTNIFAKTVFQFESLNIQFFDTDGQLHTQQSKFQSFLEKKTFRYIIYVISLSNYHNKKKFKESLELFERSVQSIEINQLPWLLIFNKLDILEKNEVKFPLKNYFDDFHEDMEPVEFLTEKYLNKIQNIKYDKEISWVYDQNGIVRILKTLEENIKPQ